MLRVSSFGSTLRVYGVAAGGCLIPVGAGVDRLEVGQLVDSAAHDHEAELPGGGTEGG